MTPFNLFTLFLNCVKEVPERLLVKTWAHSQLRWPPPTKQNRLECSGLVFEQPLNVIMCLSQPCGTTGHFPVGKRQNANILIKMNLKKNDSGIHSPTNQSGSAEEPWEFSASVFISAVLQ